MVDDHGVLFKGADKAKDQSYFLHAVSADAFAETVFPLGDLQKAEVRGIARDFGLKIHNKKDSTGICFIGERPFREFLSTYIPANPGPMETPEGNTVGEHQGLMYYTLGQRQGLYIGGRKDGSEEPWYVVAKNVADNKLIVAQGEHELLFSNALTATDTSWIGSPPADLADGLRCSAKIRYRQADQPCVVSQHDSETLRVAFDERQKAVAPGQFVVFYVGDHCLGGAVIDSTQ